MKISQITYWVFGFLFLVFAILQYNDPDFYIWIPIYGWVALLYFLAAKHVFWRTATALSGLLLLVWIVTYIPSVLEWVSSGAPSITGSMKVESPYIEHMREFLGLLICFVAVLAIFLNGKKIKNV